MDGLAELHAENTSAIHFIQTERENLGFSVYDYVDRLENLGLVPYHPFPC